MCYRVLVFYKSKSCEAKRLSLATIAVLLQTDKEVTRVIIQPSAFDTSGIMLFPEDWAKIMPVVE